MIYLLLITMVSIFTVGCNKHVHGDNDTIKTIHVTEGGGIDDGSFNASAWVGITDFFNERGINHGFGYITSNSLDAMESTLMLATDLNTDIVTAAGFNFANVMEKVSLNNPNQKYLLIDGNMKFRENVKVVLFAEEQAGFLVGYLAALKSQEMSVENPVFGFIGGVPGSVVTRFEMGYIQGIKNVLPDAELVSHYTDSWIDPSNAKIVVTNWLQTYPSLFTVFSAAGMTGNGSIAQIKEARLDGRNVWAIGVDSDQFESGFISSTENIMLTSALKSVNIAIYQTLTDLENGVFTPGITIFDLNNNGVDYSRSHEAVNSSKYIINRMDFVIDNIKNGSIKVLSTRVETEEAGFIKHNTRAAD